MADALSTRSDSVVEREADAARQQRDDQRVQADALLGGDLDQPSVQPNREANDELPTGFHAANSTTCSIDISSTAGNTNGMLPGSAYSTFPPEQIAACDRIEAEHNRQRRTTLALADAKAGHTVRGMTDGMLRSLAKTYRRQLEDIADGSLAGGERHARVVRAKLRDIQGEQELRKALAETWQACEDGTHSYTAFMGRGGLQAVLDHGAAAPTYDLAIFLDRERWMRGLPHVLDWQADAA